MSARIHIGLSDQALSYDAAHAFVADEEAGAVVLFAGTARAQTSGRRVEGLEYEAFAEQARPQMEALAADIARSWPSVIALWMEHRTGALAPGDPAVVVAVSAPHRPDAFDAARYGIDTLKETVAIWKKEHWADGGAHWPGAGDATPASRPAAPGRAGQD